jgi:hypothetical protein
VGRYALLIGTSAYHADPGLPGLPSVQVDVPAMKQALNERGEFDTVEDYLDLPREQIGSLLQDFYSGRSVRDMLLLYYSGHGLVDEDDQTLFLGATDTCRDTQAVTGVDTNVLLWSYLRNTRAGQRLVLLDCCFSGAFGDQNRVSGHTRAGIGRLSSARGTFILTASGRYQSARQSRSNSSRPSLFTAAVLDALTGKAPRHDPNGWLTARDLAEYVQDRVPRQAAGQSPHEFSEGVTGPIPVVNVTGAAAAAVDNKPTAARRQGFQQPVDAPLDDNQWRRLITYYIRCLEHEAYLDADLDQSKSDYRVMPAGLELLLSGTATGRIPVPGTLTEFAARPRENDAPLAYGYPLVVRHRAPSRTGGQRPYLSPLLVAEVSIDAGQQFTTNWPPQVNPTLLADADLDPAEIEELTELVEDQLVRGDPSSLRTVVQQILTVLGVHDLASVDPTGLDGLIRPGPTTNHARNVAILFNPGAGQFAHKKVLEDLRELQAHPATIGKTALAALAGQPDTPIAETPSHTLVAARPLNEAQEQVIAAAMTQRLTVAQGPPGTGKSQLVTALIGTATAANQTVVLASTNNQPVTDVTQAANDLAPGLIQRTGNKDEQAKEIPTLTALLDHYGPTGPETKQNEKNALRALESVAETVAALREELDHRQRIEADLADLAAERTAVAADAPTIDLPDDNQHLVRLARRTERAAHHRILGWWDRRRLRAHGLHTAAALTAFADRCTRELHWRERRRQEAALRDIDTVWRELTTLTGSRRQHASLQLLQAQAHLRIDAGRAQLEARRDSIAKNPWTGFRAVLHGPLPAWGVTAHSARSVFPKDSPGLFDLLIIDEAAQCNIAVILPLLYRAKRALIIGDPKQIPPVITLPRDHEALYRAATGLGDDWLQERHLIYTADTLYDAAAAASTPLLLDEHYRCHPDIITIPNHAVYDSKLTVLTDVTALKAPDPPAVEWINQPGTVRRPAGGSAVNDQEVQAVVDVAASLSAQYPQASLGIISPFRPQAQNINHKLGSRGLQDWAGTIHKFQGSERDIIVLSPTGAPDIAPATQTWLLRQTNLWNVAITRAKSRLVIVGDRDWWASHPSLLTDLANSSATSVYRHISPAAAALQAALLVTDYASDRDVEIAGQICDFVLTTTGGPVGLIIDEPATANGHRFRQLLSRVDAARRTRTPVYRIPAWRCYDHPEVLINKLTNSAQSFDAGSLDLGIDKH